MTPASRPERLTDHRNWHTTQINSIKLLRQVGSTQPPTWRHDPDFHFGLPPIGRYQRYYGRKDEPGTEYVPSRNEINQIAHACQRVGMLVAQYRLYRIKDLSILRLKETVLGKGQIAYTQQFIHFVQRDWFRSI